MKSATLVRLSIAKACIDFFVYTNLFLGVCVSSLVFETFVLLEIKEFDFYYVAFLFCATVFLYCFHSIFKIINSEKSSLLPRHEWIIKNKLIFSFIFISTGIGALTSAFHFDTEFLLYIIPIILFSLAYTIPFIPRDGDYIPIREIPGVKIFLISIILSITTVLLPVYLYGGIRSVSYFTLATVFLRRFLFIFAITIPFDIRDMVIDKRKGTLTIPVLLGEKRSKTIAILALILFTLLSLVHYYFMKIANLNLLGALVLSATFSALLVSLSDSKKSDYFYALWVEGLMLVQCLLVLLSVV